jgi:hypothetical protein
LQERGVAFDDESRNKTTITIATSLFFGAFDRALPVFGKRTGDGACLLLLTLLKITVVEWLLSNIWRECRVCMGIPWNLYIMRVSTVQIPLMRIFHGSDLFGRGYGFGVYVP